MQVDWRVVISLMDFLCQVQRVLRSGRVLRRVYVWGGVVHDLSGLLLRVLAMAKLFSHTVAAGTTRPT